MKNFEWVPVIRLAWRALLCSINRVSPGPGLAVHVPIVMMRRIELEVTLGSSNTVSNYLNPHKRWIDHLADQVMESFAAVPHDGAIQGETAGKQLSDIQIPLSQSCHCAICILMRKL
ncbi:hypothetical protein [Pseudomonas sp. NPDC089569]|uniref:hypothetical protein n=1 Tax=Pseudomonas sp. NPDC089569 TaxID=3390722 RepID=UPI003D047124